MRKLRVLVAVLGLVVAVGLVGVMAAGTFPGAGQDSFASKAMFKMAMLDGTVITSPQLNDPATVIGRSSAFTEGTEPPGGVAVDNSGFADTLAVVADGCLFPADFPETPGTRREVHTEILSLNLAGDGVAVKAGQAYYDSAGVAVRNVFYRNSVGEVASLDPSGNTSEDFPADSFFNVFVEVTTPGGTFYNLTPLVLRSTDITGFPPDLNLTPYIHDTGFPAIPLFDAAGVHQMYLLNAGHGGDVSGTTLPPVLDAPRLIEASRPVTFAVDDTSSGLPLPSSPNNVRDDGGDPDTAYQSSGATPGDGPDTSNIRVAGLVGSFAVGDAINSLSFGRDGTLDPFQFNGLPGALYFSVDRDAVGETCTDVWINVHKEDASVRAVKRQAAPIYTSMVAAFGQYADDPVIETSTGGINSMVADGTALGLQPRVDSAGQDNVTGLEVSDIEAGDLLYATFTGPSFASAGQRATIYFYDPGSQPFEVNKLQVYATPANLGLDPGDVIDALAVSKDSSEVLFSLAPGSPSVTGGLSAADVLYSSLGGSNSLFATADSLGLLTTDNLDAIDIRPAEPPPIAVGGIAEAPELGELPVQTAEPSSGSSALLYALAGASLAAVAAIVAGAWYTRRR